MANDKELTLAVRPEFLIIFDVFLFFMKATRLSFYDLS
jgi:hypothetical protein